MKRKTFIILSLAGILFLAAGAGSGLAAFLQDTHPPTDVHTPSGPQEQMGGAYGLTWTTIAGGGLTQGGVFSLNGAIGQSGASITSANPYTLTGGFYSGLSIYSLYLPAIKK